MAETSVFYGLRIDFAVKVVAALLVKACFSE
jgi:hypothetical protein